MPQYDLIAYLSSNGAAWVKTQHDRFYPRGSPIAAANRLSLNAYFPTPLLQSVRLASVPFIENPPFYEDLRRVGVEVPLDFRQMAGITFDRTVLVAEAARSNGGSWISLLFHELVHVTQYAILGVDEFISQYVSGWASNGLDYFSIPLERVAYALQAEFESGKTFSVDSEVRRSLGM